MVGEDAVGGVDVALVLGAELAAVLPGTGKFVDRVEVGAEEVGVVVGADVVQDRDEALEAHAGVDVLVGQGAEGAVGLAVELDEDEVPDLEDIGVVLVDQVGGFAPADAVEVDLGAGAAGAGVAHLPEVVLGVAREDAVLREVAAPEVAGLEVGGLVGGGVALEVGGVEAIGGELADLGQELPGPVDGVLLEVVAEGPVAQHLEEGVVVAVAAYVLEVVVLTPGADALLAVDGPLEPMEGGARGGGPLKEGFELIHARIGEEQGRVIMGDDRRRGDMRVLTVPKEVDEGGADLVGGRHGRVSGGWSEGRGMVAGLCKWPHFEIARGPKGWRV